MIEKFSSSGALVGSIFVGFPSAVAVDQASGEVYVSETFGAVHVFDDEGTELRSFGALPAPTALAVANGVLYVANGGGFSEEAGEAEAFSSTGTPLHKLSASRSLGVAVDPENEHAYVDEGNKVAEFDTAGNPVGSLIGADRLSRSIGLAVHGGEIYVADRGPGPETGEIDVFGTPVLPPDRETDNPLVIDWVGSPKPAIPPISRPIPLVNRLSSPPSCGSPKTKKKSKTTPRSSATTIRAGNSPVSPAR